MDKLVLGIIGIVAILIASAVLRGLIAKKTGYYKSSNSELGNAIADLAIQSADVSKMRKEVYKRRDAFRGTPIIENLFNLIFDDPDHLPGKIALNSEGIFVVPFDPETQKYATTWVKKAGEGDLPSFDYVNGCAVFLLIQEKYPKLYDFPNTKITDFQNGTVDAIYLNLKSAGEIITW